MSTELSPGRRGGDRDSLEWWREQANPSRATMRHRTITVIALFAAFVLIVVGVQVVAAGPAAGQVPVGHTLTIEVLDHNGQPPCEGCIGYFDVWDDTPSPAEEAAGTRVRPRYYNLIGKEGQPGVYSKVVPPGVYSIFTVLDDLPDGADVTRMDHLIELEVTVEGDTTVTLDAREAVRMDPPEVPHADVQVRAHVFSFCHNQPPEDVFACYPSFDVSGNEWVSDNGVGREVYVTPFGSSKETTYLLDRWILAEPQPLEPVPNMTVNQRMYSPTPDYLYNIAMLYDQGVTAQDLSGRSFTAEDFVAVPASYHADQPGALIGTTWDVRPAGRGTNAESQVFFEPGEVTEYYLASDRLIWQRSDWLRFVPEPGMSEASLVMSRADAFLTSEAGTVRETEQRFSAPHQHGMPETASPQFWELAGSDDFILWPGTVLPADMSRGGDGSEFTPPFHHVWNLAQAGLGSATGPNAFDTSWRMWNTDTGAEMETYGGGVYGHYPAFRGLTPERATYRLEQTDAYPDWMAPYFRTKPSGTSTTVWTFTSEQSEAQIPDGYRCSVAWDYRESPYEDSRTCQIQPLIQLRYDLGLDAYNQAPAGRRHAFAIEAGPHTAAVGAAPVTELTVQASFDDGATWEDVPALADIPSPQRQAALSEEEGVFQFQINKYPGKGRTSGYVSLRVQATDANGGTIDQTIQRAYLLK